jgi:hypothetical protein
MAGGGGVYVYSKRWELRMLLAHISRNQLGFIHPEGWFVGDWVVVFNVYVYWRSALVNEGGY